MTTIATVVVDPPSGASAFLVRWPQAYVPGTDDTDEWFVTTTIGTKQVQRDRLTDNVYTCQVLVAAGTTSFTVTTGADTSPSNVWSAPSLDQLGIQFTGFEAGDKSIHKADFLDTTTQEIVRDGHMERTIYRYMMTKVSHVGDATGISVGDGISCCHVWIHYRADNANVLEVEFCVSNAAAEVETDAAKIAARGGGLKVETAPTTFGFLFCDPIIPTGWTLTYKDRPLVETGTALPATELGYISNAHCLPKRMGTSRRWVLSKDSAGASAVTLAGELGQLLGLGRASYVSGQRSYHTVRAWGPTKSLIPDLATLYTGGYAAAKSESEVVAASLRAAAAAGTSGSVSQGFHGGQAANVEAGANVDSSRMGLLHPGGREPFEESADGHDIEVFCGARMHVREFTRHAMLYSSMKMDGSGAFLFERTTGKHLTNKHFTDAFAGGTVGFSGTGTVGQRPFAFETDQNSGGEYRASRQQRFAGVIPRAQSWPPHFYSSGGWPGQGNSDSRWWPELQSDWTAIYTTNTGSAPKSIWVFQCNYRPLLEQIPIPVTSGGLPVFVNGKPTYFAGSGNNIAGRAHTEGNPTAIPSQGQSCWRDMEDDQHGIRTFSKLPAAIWNGCDLLSIHMLKSVANWYGWRSCESYTTPTGDTTLDHFCLPWIVALQQQAPNQARYGFGRGAAWQMYVLACHYAVADSTERDLGYSQGRGLRARAEKYFDACRLGIITQSGMTAVGGFGGGSSSPYAPPNGVGTIPFSYGIMQAGLELPKVYAGFWALLKGLEADLPAASIAHAKQLIMQGFNDYIARTNLYNTIGSEQSPFNFVATWTNQVGAGALPVTGTPVTGAERNALQLRSIPGQQPHWDDCSFIPEIAYRITGDGNVLRVLNSLAVPNPPGTNPIVKAGTLLNSSSAYNPGLIAEVQRLLGAEGGTVAPSTNPTVVPTAQVNPAPIGSTVVFTATVTKGTNPLSTGLGVTIDFSTLGIVDPVYDMLDDGNAPDATAGDLIFTTELDTTGNLPGTYDFPVRVGDAQGRRSTVHLSFTISNTITDPIISSVIVAPTAIKAGDDVVIYIAVKPGSDPESTGLTVELDLSVVGGASKAEALDDGVSPDVSASDGTYTIGFTLGSEVVPGTYAVPITVTDDQERTVTGTAMFDVYEAPSEPEATTIYGYALSAPVLPEDTLSLRAIVYFGTGSIGGDLTVTADLSAIGGNSALAPTDTIDDHTFGWDYTVPAETAAGSYTIGFHVDDGENETSADASITLEVDAPFDPTDPQILPSASPNPVQRGSTVTLHATVAPGTSPDSTGLVVTADLSALGRAVLIPLVDTGVAPDVTADDLIFTTSFTVSAFLTPGAYSIPVTVVDDQERSATMPFTLYVTAPVVPPPIPDHPVSAMYDTLTHSTARITEGSTGKILRYVRDGLNAPLLQANVDHFAINVFGEANSGPEIPIWTSGRLEPDAQNADGTVIVKSAVTIDGGSPSRAGHTLELMLDATTIGLKGDNSYRVQVQIWLVEPAIVTTITIPLACDEAYGS